MSVYYWILGTISGLFFNGKAWCIIQNCKLDLMSGFLMFLTDRQQLTQRKISDSSTWVSHRN